jgi:2-haloacid dehalogenase
MRAQGVVFDAYGTLFDVFSVTRVCEQLFPGYGERLAQAWRAKQLQYSLLRAAMGRYENFWRLTPDGLTFASRSLKLNLTPAARDQLMNAYLTLAPFSDVQPGLTALRNLGLRLAILSNGEPKMLAAAVMSADLDHLLDETISVDEIGVYKPSAEVYALAPSRLGLDVKALLFVSSTSWDVCGAASAGFTTCWIRRAADDPPEELGFTASHVIGALTELPALLEQ